MNATDKKLRQLDAWIAENAMLWKRVKYINCVPCTFSVTSIGIFIHHRGNELKHFHPTTDPAAAMMVWKSILEIGTDFGMAQIKGKFRAFRFTDLDVDKKWWVEADTVELVICLLAKQLFRPLTPCPRCGARMVDGVCQNHGCEDVRPRRPKSISKSRFIKKSTRGRKL